MDKCKNIIFAIISETLERIQTINWRISPGIMNEWEFTAQVASWIDEILHKDMRLPFEGAKCEQTGKDSRKRRDLTLLDRDQRPAIPGEIKLPYNRDGGTPYNSTLVRDARSKAQRAGVHFFFTWNVNEFVLWETAQNVSSG